MIKKMMIVSVVAMSIGLSTSAFASHDHYLVTLGTTVEDIAKGQTSKGSGEGGFHKFHDNVHLGVPGTFGFDQPNNPVDVFKY